jgi:glycerophosphoryl diester phosphodiesterase
MEWTDHTDKKYKIELIAHRGANGIAPENTMAAFKACLSWNLDYVEIDVRSSLDGILYNYHDNRLGRTSNGNGLFRLRRSKYIDRLDAGSWFSDSFAGEKIPRVEDLLKAAVNRTKLYFDVKQCNLERLLFLIKKYELSDQCFFWFQNAGMMKSFKIKAPHMSLKLNCSEPEHLSDLKTRYRPRIIECDHNSINDKMVSECRRLGFKLMVNFKGDDIESFKKAIRSGADMIVLDYPVKYLRSLSDMVNG